MDRRAYSLLQIRAVDADKRIITGIATTPTPDSYGDVVEPEGADYKLPLPLLWQHDSRGPVGEVFSAKTTAEGIEIKARIAQTDTPGNVKTRLDDAWESLKLGLVKGLSIGFRSIEESYDKATGGYHFLKWVWHELSLVTIPANADCTIQTIRAASGAPASPGASGSSRVVSMRSERTTMKKSFADQIADWEKTRASKVARQEEIQRKATEDGRSKDDSEREEFETLDGDISGIDKELADLRKLDAREKAAALPVSGRTTSDGSLSRTPTVTVEKKLPPGIAFARYAMCMGMARGNPFEAKQIAKDNYGDDAGGLVQLIDLHQKGAVGAANTQTVGWATELVPYTIMDDFIEYLRPRTIVGKFGTNGIPPLRRVPFNVRTSGFSAGLSANWIGEGLPILLSKATSYAVTLTWAKLAALAVLTKEEIRFSNPSAEAKVRDDLARAIVEKQDKDFIDPAKAAVANVSPASITWNTTPISATGATAANFRTDLATLLATFATAKLDPSDIVLIMSTVDALNISLMINSLGVQTFPGVTMAGGNLLGFPVITTEAMVSIGSPVSNIIVAVKAGDIYLADDGVVTVDASDQASIEMVDSSSQSGITGTGASQVSLWQTNMVGLKATREITWKLRRTGAARYIISSAYKA